MAPRASCRPGDGAIHRLRRAASDVAQGPRRSPKKRQLHRRAGQRRHNRPEKGLWRSWSAAVRRLGGPAPARDFQPEIVHCRGLGAGCVQAVNNAFLGTSWRPPGLAALVKMGVDPKVALDVINASSGRSNASMNLIPERVITRKFPRTFRLALLEKDVGIAAEVARDTRTPAPILQLTADLFRIARSEFGEVADHVEAVKMVEQWAGVEIA